MSLPQLKIDQKIIDLRMRGNCWDQLKIALDNLVLDREYELDTANLIGYVAQSITDRMAPLHFESNEHANLQMLVDVLEKLEGALKPFSVENSGVRSRTEALEQLKTEICGLNL